MRSTTSQRGKVAYKVLGVLVGLVFLVYGCVERRDVAKVQRLGKSAVVAPISSYTEYRNRGTTTYTAEFRFKTDTGREVVLKHSFPKEVLDDFKSGAPVRVLYLPDDPYTFVFEKERPSWTLVIAGLAVAVAALIFG
jgi:hypothetical protein